MEDIFPVYSYSESESNSLKLIQRITNYLAFFLPDIPIPALPEPESKFLVPVPLTPYLRSPNFSKFCLDGTTFSTKNHFLIPKCRGWMGVVTDLGLVPKQPPFYAIPTHCASVWISSES